MGVDVWERRPRRDGHASVGPDTLKGIKAGLPPRGGANVWERRLAATSA